MKAIVNQAAALDQVIFAGFTHPAAEEVFGVFPPFFRIYYNFPFFSFRQVARGLVAVAPAGLTRVFFSDSGSTAVEVALKMALGYWRRRYNDGEYQQGHPKGPRHRILTLEHSYHGDTVGTM
jgi:adenosylmethionine-8-amino-7-oxononanoate aminotransferase